MEKLFEMSKHEGFEIMAVKMDTQKNCVAWSFDEWFLLNIVERSIQPLYIQFYHVGVDLMNEFQSFLQMVAPFERLDQRCW